MPEDTSVLIVDDNGGMTETLSDILNGKGYQATVAASGEEAIDRTAERSFDVILMDIKMPGISGVEALKAIRQRCPEALVVMMTAYTIPDLIKEAEKEGALATMTKPVDVDKIIAFLEESGRGGPTLIVDDEPAFCESLADSLKAHGYDVAYTTDAHEAIQMGSSGQYPFIILDMKLDYTTGRNVFVAIRQVNPATAFILMTGYGGDVRALVEECLRESAYACLHKPFEMTQLMGLLEEVRQNKLAEALGEPRPKEGPR